MEHFPCPVEGWVRPGFREECPVNLAKVTWLDAGVYPGHQATPSACSPYKKASVGWVIEGDGDWVCVASEIQEDEHFCDVTVIPKGMVVSIEPLELKT